MLWSVETFVSPYFRFLGNCEFVGQLYTSKMMKVSTSALNISILRKIGFKTNKDSYTHLGEWSGQLYTSKSGSKDTCTHLNRETWTVIHI